MAHTLDELLSIQTHTARLLAAEWALHPDARTARTRADMLEGLHEIAGILANLEREEAAHGTADAA